MAELRVKSTGTLKLFENDNTSSVTIASPASLGGDRTITLPDGDVTLFYICPMKPMMNWNYWIPFQQDLILPIVKHGV